MPITITHILAEPTDKKTLCGEKRDGVPNVWAPFVGAHQRGHGMVLCTECRQTAARESISLDGA